MGMTQGLLAAMVADPSPGDLSGTADGLFNLLSGLALPASSVVAGLLWDAMGSAFTFYAGAGFALLTLLGMAMSRAPEHQRAKSSRVPEDPALTARDAAADFRPRCASASLAAQGAHP